MTDTTTQPLRQRARAPTPAELAAIPWLAVLEPAQRTGATAQLQVVQAEVGERLCRIGKPATYWFGVIDGLLKMSNDDSSGPPITFTGVPPGGWFGEGTLLKREAYRYNIQALRRSVVAGLPIETFHALLESSIAFNRFMLNQLNERLGQFIGRVEHDRLLGPDARVASSLASLFNPTLYPGVKNQLQISQEEIGYLAGLSRQRANQALQALEKAGLVHIEYGGITVLDIAGLRSFGGA